MANESKANESKIQEIVKGLLNGKTEGALMESFNPNSLDILSDNFDTFWSAILDFMKKEKDTSALGHYGIKEEDLLINANTDPDTIENYKQSIGNFINQKADLINSFLDTCLDLSTNRQAHWNEGFDQLIQSYMTYFTETDQVIDSTNISISDLIYANAGNSFSYEGEDNDTTQGWVRPWKNISGSNYGKVRANDKIIRVLNDNKNLQFTHLFKKYLRLLMPEYERIVEVEDLNRNFWVTGQVLTGICAFLFDETSPLNSLIEGLLDEITQLWENMLYLWIAFALISQLNEFNDIQMIVIPVNNDIIRPYIKFDDFIDRDLCLDEEEILEALWTNHLSYLKNKYRKSTLVVIPEVRMFNYYKNFYAQSYYPGVIILNRRYRQKVTFDEYNAFNFTEINDKELTYHAFDVNENNFFIDCSASPGQVSICGERKTISGLALESPMYYYKESFSSLSSEDEQRCYYGGARVVFKDAEINFDENNIKSFAIEADIYDIATDFCVKGDSARIMTIAFKNDDFSTSQIIQGMKKNNDDYSHLSDSSDFMKSGLYFGEFPSWRRISDPTFSINIQKTWSGNFPSKISATIKAIPSIKNDPITQQEIKTGIVSLGTTSTSSQISGLKKYDSIGNLINYTIEEEMAGVENVNISMENFEKITGNSPNKIVKITNSIPIEYETVIKSIDLNAIMGVYDYDNFKEWIEGDREYGVIDVQKTQLGTMNLSKAINKYLSDQTIEDNKAYVFLVHVGRVESATSGGTSFEMIPRLVLKYPGKDFIILKISSDNNISYNTNYEETRKPSAYPLMDSDKNTESTSKLKWWSKDGTFPTSSNKALVNKAKAGGNGCTMGNIRVLETKYDNSVTGELDLPSLRLTSQNGELRLYNFILIAYNRSLAFYNDSNSLCRVAYYYKCELIGDEIKATYVDGEIPDSLPYDGPSSAPEYYYNINSDYGEFRDEYTFNQSNAVDKVQIKDSTWREVCEKMTDWHSFLCKYAVLNGGEDS